MIQSRLRPPSTALFLVSCLALAAAGRAAAVHAAAAFDGRPAAGVLQRLLPPQQAAQFRLGMLEAPAGEERFRIASVQRHIAIDGSTPSALLFGVNWYLKYVAHEHVSSDGDQLDAAGTLPLPAAPIEGQTRYRYRYALNQNVDGYTAAYWDWPRWEREIDVLALSGINALVVERGADMVLYRTFRDFGYSDAQIRAWLTLPAHQNWQLMGNLCCFNGPISGALLHKRLASSFYRHQRELFGDSRIYDMEVFQEGGNSGDVPVAAAARAVQDALQAAHPGASWMMLAWEGNPRRELLAGVARGRLLIIDI
ncbi:MAG TPA: alpha-N-acetylglucosaminidase TIM-barrel domain-containing protein, partial [Candidatus Dormibacteraeota bacterium]|nr:alpha-N-acetylglucosaminidase TIM-barrel domain-containing protein [Candidatus Dormibacteraeota bacterium]